MKSPGRNSPCPCSSGKKFKKCCGKWQRSYTVGELTYHDQTKDRSCGDCRACCTALSVEYERGGEEKPCFLACRHEVSEGCGIYDQRPSPCESYACLWLKRILMTDTAHLPDDHPDVAQYRPDKLGAIFDMWDIDNYDDGRAPKTPTVSAYELWPGAIDMLPGTTTMAGAVLSMYADQCGVKLVRRDVDGVILLGPGVV